MADDLFNVLFLCTGNSARSSFGKCLINRMGRGKFRGYSAGSHPKGEVHPLAFYELERNNYLTDGLRSKDWNEFAAPDAPTWTSYSPSVIRRQRRSAQSGRASR